MTSISIGDAELYVLERGSGAPLLLVHGFPLDHQMWQGQIDVLAQNFHVLAPDLRGFGSSSGQQETVSMERFADDLAQLLEAMRITQPIIFCGLSMGGYIAWQFWQRHRDRLSHLILCDTRAADDPPDVAATRLQTAEQVLGAGSAVLVEGMIPKLFCERTRTHQRDLVTATVQVMRAAPPKGVAAALRGMAQRVDATGWLAEIQLPTLVICGRHDAISSVAEMQRIAEAIPQAELAVIEDAGHMAPLENAPAVNEAIQKFLGVLPSSPSSG